MSDAEGMSVESFARQSIESALRMLQTEGRFHPYVETLPNEKTNTPLGFKFRSVEANDISREYRVVLDTLKELSSLQELHAFSIVTKREHHSAEDRYICVRADIEVRGGYAAWFDFDCKFSGEQLELADAVVTKHDPRVFV